MTCYSPIVAYRSSEVNPATGKRPLVFSLKVGLHDMPVQIPCGQCIGCRLEKARQWAMRCVCEASLYENNIFLTLTYDTDHLPSDLSLSKRHLQLFMKRLRKRFGNDIRFYACGEYGSKFGRPHYHILLFNFNPKDGQLIRIRPNPLYVSESISRLWHYGFHSYGLVTFESASYVARYCTKKITGADADDYYKGRLPEFALMSRKPGIGHDWLLKYSTDVYPNDYIVMRDGLKLKPPIYFDNIYDKFTENLDNVKLERRKRAFDSFHDYCKNSLEVAYNSNHISMLFDRVASESILVDQHRYSEKFQKLKLQSKREMLESEVI